MILFNLGLVGSKAVHTVLKGISPKVNVTERLELELTYDDAAVQSQLQEDSPILPSTFVI